MNLEKLEKVIELARKHGVFEIKVKDGDTEYAVKTGAPTMAAPSPYFGAAMPTAPMPPQAAAPAEAPAAAPAPASGATAAAAVPANKVIKSPFVGTYYGAPSPGAEPFVSVGTRVKKGDTLCIVEAMKLMNEIEAEVDGVIKEILADNEQPVEFDQPLFILE